MAHNAHKPLEEKLGYRFRNPALLDQALTHSSATTDAFADNERMEFLGDSVLALIISDRLFRDLGRCDEGELTRIKSGVVSTVALARCAQALDLADHALFGGGIRRAHIPASVHANLAEAIFAAVYLDGGLDPARRLVERLLQAEIEATASGERDANYKSVLQEHTQRALGVSPQYQVVSETGPDHGKVFQICVVIGEVSYPPGEGQSKKQAEQRAAARALSALGVST